MSVVEVPSKILLFGEYTILSGSKALAVPYSFYFGQWNFNQISSELRISSQQSLQHFNTVDWSHILDQDQLRQDLSRGLWFDSSIPQGFGLGSSGALVAALHQTYGKKQGTTAKIREDLACMESFFHGSSSGIDPLVSYLHSPLLIHHFDHVDTVESELDLNGFFLINSGRPRRTGALVNLFTEKLKDTTFKRNCQDELSFYVNQAILALFDKNPVQVFTKFMDISKFQWDYFQEMIPKDLGQVWTRGLDSRDYVMKLCGAGGGGFFLGYCPNKNLIGSNLGIQGFEIRWLK